MGRSSRLLEPFEVTVELRRGEPPSTTLEFTEVVPCHDDGASAGVALQTDPLGEDDVRPGVTVLSMTVRDPCP